MSESPALVLFELEHHGHHPHYVRHLVEAWLERDTRGPLALVVTPAFAAAHGDVLALAREARPGAVQTVLVAPEEAEALRAAPAIPAVALQSFARGRLPDDCRPRIYWDVVNRHAERLRPARVLLMHLDLGLPSIAAGLPAALPFSGILFRPSFHYPAPADPVAARAAALHGTHERFLFARALRHPMLRTVFCLDPTVVPALAGQGRPVVPLPDPLPYPAAGPDAARQAAARAALGVAAARRVLLLFGAIAPRKGWRQLVAALHLLPKELTGRVCLLVVGQGPDAELAALREALAGLGDATGMQVLSRPGYAEDSLVPLAFAAADVVLAPYQRHAGMSGVLLLAAAHGKPVLSQSYGLMGRLTREHGLGLAVDTGDVGALAEALRTCLARPPEELGDRRGMRALADRHRPDRFARTLLEHLL